MSEAVQLSIDNVQNNIGGPFGCVIVDKDGKTIIGKGANRSVIDHDPTSHAEIVALRKACQEKKSWNLSGCTVYSSCEPCPMCYSALMWARIEEIYFANTRQDAHSIGFQDQALYDKLVKSPLPHSKRVISSEALKAFEIWQASADKIKRY